MNLHKDWICEVNIGVNSYLGNIFTFSLEKHQNYTWKWCVWGKRVHDICSIIL